MGNKCCSRRHDVDRPLGNIFFDNTFLISSLYQYYIFVVYPAINKNESGFGGMMGVGGGLSGGTLETRYTGEPNTRLTNRRGADIVRTRTPCM